MLSRRLKRGSNASAPTLQLDLDPTTGNETNSKENEAEQQQQQTQTLRQYRDQTMKDLSIMVEYKELKEVRASGYQF
jgi:hypothetical protein